MLASKIMYSLIFDQTEENPDALLNEWNINPESPCSGDVLDIEGSTEPFETIGMTVSFSLYVPVVDNRYEYTFDNIRIPGGSNSFLVRAQKVEDLNFIVRMFADFKRSFEAENGVAQFFEKNIPSGNYEIMIEGKALDGENEVRLDFVANQTIKADKEGNFVNKYDTRSLPDGDFKVKVGDREKMIKLMPSK